MAAFISPATSAKDRFDWTAVEKIPVCVAVFAGLVFTTGFIVEISFLDRFGLRETGVEFFKAKYLHVGILDLLFSCLVAVPCYAIIYLHFRTRKHAVKVRYAVDKTTGLPPFVLNLPMACLAVNLLLLIYIFAVLAPPSMVVEKKQFLALILVVTITSPWIALWVVKAVGAVGERRRVLREWLLAILCLPVLAADLFALRGAVFKTIIECVCYGGYLFFVFSILVYVIAHVLKARAHRMPDSNARLAWWTAGVCVIAATYYLSVISFAYRVYPFIPADKGGGDYTEAATVTIRLHDGAIVPSEMLARSSTPTVSKVTITSKPLIIIEETPACVYVADPADAGGPFSWRTGSIPKIIQITRSDIASIAYAGKRRTLTSP
jgi:hypothetical protein